MVSSVTKSGQLPVGKTTMNVSIHEDNSGAHVLAKTLPPQFTPQSKIRRDKTKKNSISNFISLKNDRTHLPNMNTRTLKPAPNRIPTHVCSERKNTLTSCPRRATLPHCLYTHFCYRCRLQELYSLLGLLSFVQQHLHPSSPPSEIGS